MRPLLDPVLRAGGDLPRGRVPSAPCLPGASRYPRRKSQIMELSDSVSNEAWAKDEPLVLSLL